jgi:hypothetical protein
LPFERGRPVDAHAHADRPHWQVRDGKATGLRARHAAGGADEAVEGEPMPVSKKQAALAQVVLVRRAPSTPRVVA